MQHTETHTARRRALALVLALALALGLVPGFPGTSETAEAHWADAYLDAMVEWGFIRPDQKEHPNDILTRADFMAIINRAYGYTKGGPTPFEDVEVDDWFYDDVGIAYNANYIYGTSPTTVSPYDPLTRETSATILGRNMMLRESEGEILDFSDAREISAWARGTIKSSLEHYLVNGYDDGTFKPQKDLTWGEMAAMVTRIVGVPIQEPGDYALGGIFGNVTVSSDGVTLRDSIISGDLYITGGVGLGGVRLENVTVLGRIIASGAGESEAGTASILLRNVVADQLLVDNLQNSFVTVQADGITEIGETLVRTSAYLEDNTPEGMGLKKISLEGELGTRLDLAGRIEEVTVRTPNAQVQVAKGTVNKLTVDESAPDTAITIARNAEVKELNLDVACYVSGDGDIKKLNVNAAGCIVTMLPEEIYIRPGITAVIHDQVMDSNTAEESGREPQILSGYPVAEDIAPTSIEAVFATNKKGTVYWAVSAITDASVPTEDLLRAPAYGDIAVARGSTAIPGADTPTGAAVTGLTPGGSYYLAAVLVDDRGQQSPTKVIAFTTPDDSVPAFAEGYPYMSLVSTDHAQATVMPTKTCKLYYVLLPAGGQVPTENELKTNSVSGNLGYGVMEVTKNTESAFDVNDLILDEKTDYVVYFWLVDANGANKSEIIPLPFTTKDETPPEFIVDPTVKEVHETSVGLTFQLNEAGTVFWAVVPEGTNYPRPRPGESSILLTDDYAILQITSGLNATVSGRVTVAEGATGTITVTGLSPESAYDFYYVAQDTAGNYSVTVKKITINTLDNNGPRVKQSFTKCATEVTEGKEVRPLANTDIILDFSENVRYSGAEGGRSFLELYEAVRKAGSTEEKNTARRALAQSLAGSVKLFQEDLSAVGNSGGKEVTYNLDPTVNFADEQFAKYTIDYTQATVESKDGHVLLTFPAAGLHLDTGGVYHFEISSITDTSNAYNPIVPSTVRDDGASEAQGHSVPAFTIEFATVTLARDPGVGSKQGPYVRDEDGNLAQDEKEFVPVDMSFRMTPTSTSTVSSAISYDVLLWTNKMCSYNLYYRVLQGANVVTSDAAQKDYLLPRDEAGSPTQVDDNGWIFLGNSGDNTTRDNQWVGKSVNRTFNNCGADAFPLLKNMKEGLTYEFVIELTEFDTLPERETWSGESNFRVYVAAGYSTNLHSLGSNVTALWERFQQMGLGGGARSIGTARIESLVQDYLPLFKMFTDTQLPYFDNHAPTFDVTDQSVTMHLTLNRPDSTIYYVIGQADTGSGNPQIRTTATVQPVVDGTTGALSGWEKVTNPVNLDRRAVPRDGWDAADPTQMAINWPIASGSGDTAVNPDFRYEHHPLENFLVTPERENIYNPTRWSEASSAKTGTIPYSGTSVVDWTVEELEPATTYYVYYVLKGQAETLSPVYIYQFTTKETKLPKIITVAPNDDGSAKIETDVVTYLDYRVFNSADAWSEIPFLKTSFTQYLKTFQDKDGNDLPADKTLPTYYDKGVDENNQPIPYTVLDALIDTYNHGQCYNSTDGRYYFDRTYNGYSVFDLYANTDARRQLHDIISRGRSSNYVPNGVDEIGSGQRIPTVASPATIDQKLNGVVDGSIYVVLTMARNAALTDVDTSDPGIYSFKAADRIQINDQTPPDIKDIVGAYAEATNVTTPNGATTYSGVINLVFDKNVFWQESRNSSRRYPAGGSNADGVSAVSILNGHNVTPNNVPGIAASATVGSVLPTDTFAIHFTNFPIGGTITVPAGHLCNASGQAATQSLVIGLRSRANGDLYVEVRWRTTQTYDLGINSSGGTEITVTSTAGPDIIGNAITLNGAGATAGFRASVLPNSDGYVYTWSVADPDIATISATTGRNVTVTAQKMGTTTVTVKAGQFSKSITVNVTGTLTPTATGATLNGSGQNYTVKWTPNYTNNQATMTLSVNSAPANGNAKITWNISGAPGITFSGGATTVENSTSVTVVATNGGSPVVTVTNNLGYTVTITFDAVQGPSGISINGVRPY